MPTIVSREPAIAVGAITTAILAIIGVTNIFGLTHITSDQGAALVAAIVALWPIVLVIRQLVTPTASPTLPEGKDVTLHDGTAGVVVKK